jgi:hypothetical protein
MNFMLEIGPALRKWALLDEMQARCVEADEDLARVTDHVFQTKDSDAWTEVADRTFEGSALDEILVPWEEFREALFFLPDLTEMPIFTVAWKTAGEPSEFVLRCFSGSESQMGDEFWVDTQGYDYPRYKAAVRRAT